MLSDGMVLDSPWIFWLVVLLGTASPSSSNVLSSLSDLDFHRIRASHAQHSSERDSSSSFPPTLSLTRQLLGAGYHRELRVNIKFQDSRGYSDKVLLVENITRDMYIDLDQIASMGELAPQILSSAHMDTEKPASASTDHVVLFYTYLINNISELQFPIHFRYQAPSRSSLYTTVVLPAPLVLMQHPVGSASLPCHPYTRDTCLWELLTPAQDAAELTAEIPCGQQNVLSSLVIGSTTLVTLVATAVVTYAMTKVKSCSHKEQ